MFWTIAFERCATWIYYAVALRSRGARPHAGAGIISSWMSACCATIFNVKNLTFIPPPTTERYQQLVNELAKQPPVLRPDQHVVSRVLLDQFAEPAGAKRQREVRILNRDRLSAKPTQLGPAGCGKFRHFVKFASQSSEEIWNQTETRLRSAVTAADKGTFYDEPCHVDAVRDAIVLHYVRSIPALVLHDETWRNWHTALLELWMTRGRGALEGMYWQRFGWYAPDEEALRMMAEDLIRSAAGHMDRGIYFRVMLVERFGRFAEMLKNQPLEIRRATGGEALIGDVPVIAVRFGHPGTGPRDDSGLANCDELVMPIGPNLFAVLGAGMGYTEADSAEVERLNAAQVRASADYVYLRPSSGLEQFVRASATADRPNRIPPHLRQGKEPRRFDPIAGRRAAA